MREILFLEPVLKNCVWGGQRLLEFGYDLPSPTTGECWCASAHPNGDCVVAGGTFGGQRLSALWRERRELFGGWADSEFPLITKIIDAQSDLSIQVHPTAEYAARSGHGSRGKVECWFVLAAEPKSSIIIGHNARTADEARQMVGQKRWREFLREVPVRQGDFFFIDAGTIHSIKGGTLIFEVQENCDLTYRLYDYDRLQAGKPRELHVEQSLEVLQVPFRESVPPQKPAKTKNSNLRQLVSCDFFSVWHADFCGENAVLQDQPFMAVTVLSGQGRLDGSPIKKGDTFILPHGYGTASFAGQVELLISSV